MTAPARPAPPRPPAFWVVVGAAAAGLVVWAAVGLDAKWSRLPEAPADLWRLAELMFGRMTWSDLGDTLAAMWDSIAIAWLGTVVAAVIAVPLSFAAARNLGGPAVSLLVRQLFNVLRAVPEVILVIALIPLLGLAPSAGVLAIAIGSIGTLGKLCAEILEAIDDGPLEASDAVGATALQRLRWGVLPQAVPELMSFVLYRFEINIRVSAVLGAVGAGGIGGRLVDSLQFKEFGRAGLALLVVIAGTMAVDAVSGSVRRRVIAGPGGRRDQVQPDVSAAQAITGL